MKEKFFENEDELVSLPGELVFNIDVMLAKRKMRVGELAERIGITMSNISILKNGKAKAIKVSTLIKLCDALDCQPGDLLEYRKLETGN
ncbi:MAG: helix-turn-helix transcriptional regulator [Clostridia bacterium]|nr:helix-turn-helix transcriptional regulator [Clostridia bacterium]